MSALHIQHQHKSRVSLLKSFSAGVSQVLSKEVNVQLNLNTFVIGEAVFSVSRLLVDQHCI